MGKRKTLFDIQEEVDDAIERNKKQKIEKLYISGTDLRNYMMNDPIVDWLKNTNFSFSSSSSSSSFNNSTCSDSFLLEKGKTFERNVIEFFKSNNVPIRSISDRITEETCMQTSEYMELGIPVIHSAPFRNEELGIQGVIDLLVRSDYLCVLTDDRISNDAWKPSKFGNFHYVVIDIKFSTLQLRSDGIHVLNSDAYPAYKAQVWLYTQGIGAIQGYTSRYAYIMGRRSTFTSCGIKFTTFKCNEKLGTIDFENVDLESVEKAKEGMKWLREVNVNGYKWKVRGTPSRPELYPNMHVDAGKWNTKKQEIADMCGELTMIWNCSYKQRVEAHKKGIFSWRDPRCTSEVLGFKNERAKIVDAILNINRQNEATILPKRITNNIFDWRKEKNEVFVDFETFCDAFCEDVPEQKKTDTIFMIGVWYRIHTNWFYKNFTVRNTSPEEEFRICREFREFLIAMNEPKVWMWCAEENIWSRFEGRHESDMDKYEIMKDWNNIDWCDLAEVFRKEPIVIKDCFKFGLKEIAKAMYKHGFITRKLDSDCQSGLEASYVAWTILSSPEPNYDQLRDIENYNRFDVEVLHQILDYLRNNL